MTGHMAWIKLGWKYSTETGSIVSIKTENMGWTAAGNIVQTGK